MVVLARSTLKRAKGVLSHEGYHT